MPITLFTGHTIASLTDILVVNPIDVINEDRWETKERRLTLTITLHNGVDLYYTGINQRLKNPTIHDNQLWDEALQNLTEQRTQLVEQWGEALKKRASARAGMIPYRRLDELGKDEL